jgi:UrcA family protein
MFKVVLLATALAVTGVSAHAGDMRDVQVRTVVPTRGVDFRDPVQVQALHAQLARKAAEICDSRQPRSLAISTSDQTCAKAALDRAVATARQPMLTAYHRGAPIDQTTRLAQR